MRIVAEGVSRIKVGDCVSNWTVVGPGFVVPNDKGVRRTSRVVECKCGTVSVLLETRLISKGPLSCGCRERAKRGGRRRSSHSLRNSAFYKRWQGIMDRCCRPKNPKFKNYGGRGITVCDEWKSYEGFKAWAMASGFREDLSIDRIDVNGPYSPSNCRWVTNQAQQRNRRNNRAVVAFGEKKLGCEWCEDVRCIVPASIFWNRLHNGWEPEEALTKPVSYRRPRKTRKQVQDGR